MFPSAFWGAPIPMVTLEDGTVMPTQTTTAGDPAGRCGDGRHYQPD
ncbi:hypothetical protein ACLK1S_04040 [Escherichia coli]